MGKWAVHLSWAPGRSQWLGSECKPWVGGRAGERGLQENGVSIQNNPQLACGERACWRVGLGARGLESPIEGNGWL